MMNRRSFAGLAATWVLGSALATRRVLAQAWPTRPVRFVVPFPAGAAPDIGCRIITPRLAEMWAQQVVVENRPGAGGNVGTEAVARSAPDGSTILMAAFTHAVNVFLYGSLGYDPVTDFAPVTLLSEQPCVMIVSNASPVHSVAEFIAFAKANPGKMTYASAGYGTSPHLCGELFKRMTGIEMKHVPYRAGAQQDLIAGHVDVMFAVAPFGLLQAGQVRGLAVTTANRIKAAPDLPTLAESGLQDFNVAPWWGFLVPARTPAAVIRKLHTDTVTALGEPKVRQKMESLGSTVVGSSPEQFSMRLKAEMAKWGPIIRDAHITIND